MKDDLIKKAAELLKIKKNWTQVCDVVDESIHIKKSHEGLLHKDLGISQNKKIPISTINSKLKAAKANHDTSEIKRLVFAKNAKTKFHHAEETDLREGMIKTLVKKLTAGVRKEKLLHKVRDAERPVNKKMDNATNVYSQMTTKGGKEIAAQEIDKFAKRSTSLGKRASALKKDGSGNYFMKDWPKKPKELHYMGVKEETLDEERKESTKVVTAFLNKTKTKGARSHTDGSALYLHGHKIAWHGENGAIHATMAGWGTKTTRDRLNTLTHHVHGKKMFHQKGGVQHYDNKPIDSDAVVQIKEANLQELSKDTLKSYVKKSAVHSAMVYRGINASLDAAEDEPEGSHKQTLLKHLDKGVATHVKRNRGIAKASDRLAGHFGVKDKYSGKFYDRMHKSYGLKESLPANADAKDYIHDFVHSKNKKFSGDSKKERIKRALGAYYHKGK